MKQTRPYHVQFVCRGNTYRSRLAAAYAKKILPDTFQVGSSGVETKRAPLRTSETYTRTVAKENGLSFEITKIKTQTNDELLSTADVIVFMNKDVYETALKSYSFDARKAIVWHVPDVDDAVKQAALAAHDQEKLNAITRRTFHLIRKNCDNLLDYLTHTAWVDVVDKDNQLQGIRLPMAWATDRGLWHRGVHVVAKTSDGKYVVGKRGNNIVFAPGMLEISLGGGVDSGELPLHAARRETYEELGVLAPEKHFQPLFVSRFTNFHPRYNKHTKTHLYVYAVTLPVHSTHLQPQPEEVAELRLLSERQIKRLLRAHRLRKFGQLSWKYQLYSKAVARSRQLV